MTPLAWMDVISTDIELTLAHYAEAFGWTSEVLPLDHGEDYRILRSSGVIVAGAEQVAAERELDSVWTVMVETEDAPALIGAAVAAGAEVTFDLAPMLDLGRIAMLRDPWGATIGVWEPGTYRPSAVPDVPGRLAGGVLTTPDRGGSIAFCREVFGWALASGAEDLDAGVPVFVEAGDVAVWTAVLAGDTALLEARVENPHLRLADAGLMRCVDPTGAPYYVLSRTGSRAEQQFRPSTPREKSRGHR
jgi:predicted enzyme related to lactoylglutathione lyase